MATASPPRSMRNVHPKDVYGRSSGPNSAPFTLVDLFCGCGGYSWGFLFPKDGTVCWRVLRGLDNDLDAVSTFNQNIGSDVARVADLEQEDPTRHLEDLDLRPGQLSCLHASPPCEAYSINNRRNGHGRDFRFRIVLNWVKVFRPRIVTIENVLRFRECGKEIHLQLAALNYEVGSFILNAADHGVPQFRKRLYYVAYHKSLRVAPTAPRASFGSPSELESDQRPWTTVRDAIMDLPGREAGEGPDRFVSRLDLKVPEVQARIGDYAALMRPPQGYGVANHQARVLNELMQRRVKALQPGQAIANLPKNLQPRMGFRNAYGRLDPDAPAKTITTGVRGPSHGPFCHYRQNRLITIREAARLQSFPDVFTFDGGLHSQARQVGNAVPPLLAAALRRQFSVTLSAAAMRAVST